MTRYWHVEAIIGGIFLLGIGLVTVMRARNESRQTIGALLLFVLMLLILGSVYTVE